MGWGGGGGGGDYYRSVLGERSSIHKLSPAHANLNIPLEASATDDHQVAMTLVAY